MKGILFLLLLIHITFSKLGSLSLYHVSGTTFLNLPKLSNRASVSIYFKNEPNIQGLEKKLKKVLYRDGKEDLDTSKKEIIFKNSILGDVYLHENSLTTGFFKSPNGHRHQQGWIQNKEQYLSPDIEFGDEKTLKKVVKLIENLPTNIFKVFVNVEIPKNVTLVRDLLINVFRYENRGDIILENDFKESVSPSIFLLKKMMQQKNGVFIYQPTFEEFFEDYMIRQTAEFQLEMKQKAWEMPLKDVSNELMKSLNELTIPNYGVDMIHWFCNYKSDHFLCKKLLEGNPSSCVQFHEFSTNVIEAVRRAVGLVKATEIYGPFISDQALTQITGVGIELIDKIRHKLIKGEQVVVKYLAWDPESCPHIHRRTIDKLKKIYKRDGVVFGFMSPQFHGYSPLVIPGNSIVWHTSSGHRFNIIGKYNPSLINFNIAQFLENKFFEFLFFRTYCPNFFPHTKHLRDILPKEIDLKNVPIDLFTDSANKEFKDGWIIKGVWESDGSHEIINHKIKGHKLLDSLYQSQFLDWASKHKFQNDGYGCDAHQGLNSVLRTSKHILAYKLHNYLHNANDVIIQQWSPSYKELKMECIGGICPKELISEFYEKRPKNETEAINKKLKEVSVFLLQHCLDNLPDKVRGLSLSVDIGIFNDLVTPVIYETNPGGKSVYILQDYETVKTHNNFLFSYPEIYASNKKIQKGLSPEDQIKYLINLIHHWDINPIEYEHRFKILPDRIIDIEQKQLIQIDLDRFNGIRAPKIASPAASIGMRYKAIRKSLEKIALYTVNVGNFTNILKFSTKLSFMKEGLNYNQLRHRIIQKLKRMRNEFLDYFLKDLTKVVKKSKSYLEPSQYILKNIDVLLGFQILNFEHSGLRDAVINIFSKLKTDEISKLFPYLDEDAFINLVKKLGKDKKSIFEFDNFIYHFSSDLYSLYGLHRFGIRVPGRKISKTINTWIHRLRALYSEKLFLQSTLKGVLTIIFVLSDNSLFYLDQLVYEKEYDFIMKAIHNGFLKDNPYLLGKTINALILLRADETFSVTELINQIRIFLLETKTKSNIWKRDGKESLTATLGAIRGLIEHNYIIESKRKMGHLVSQHIYMKRLQEMGFLRKIAKSTEPLKDEL